MERGCLAEYDRDRYTIRCTVQFVHGTRAALADRIFKLAHHHSWWFQTAWAAASA
jgi:hypothetical protein